VTDEIEVLRLFRDELPGPSTDAWARARSAIAVARSEEEAAGRGPSRGPRRRQLFSVAAGVAVAAAVAGLLAVLLPNPAATGAPGQAASAQQVRTAAYVTRVEHALASPGMSNVLGYARTVYPPGSIAEPVAGAVSVQREPGASSPWRVGFTVRWSYQGRAEFSAFTATGQRVFDKGVAITAGRGMTSVVVIYRNATWWRAPAGAARAVTGPGPSSCGPDVAIGPGGWPAFIREELRCGEYTLDGRQQIDGIDATKITGNKGLDTLWVNPATYLPMRVMLTFGRLRIQTNFRWLPPTPANLARLSVQIPAGFRQVPPPS
jgi:hypothetical protein